MIRLNHFILACFLTPLTAYAGDPSWDPFYGNIVKFHYTNIDYGFTVALPDGLTAYGADPPNPTHAETIKLGKGRPLAIFSEYNALMLPSSYAAVTATLGYDHATHVRRMKAVLDGKPAQRAEYDDKAGHRIVVIIRRRDQGTNDAILEELYMQSDQENFLADVKFFEQVLASYKELPISP